MSNKTAKSQSQKSTRSAADANDSASAVVLVRKIPEPTRLLLCVRAGGRCEFDGHNDYLFEHPITLHQGNFAEMAHIVAFKKAGSRGMKNRPDDINNVDNLMLLCPTCHKLVDDHPLEYPRERLEGYKREHEERIFHLTSLGSDRKTSVIIFKAPIAGQTSPCRSTTSSRRPSRVLKTRSPLTIDHRPCRRAGIHRRGVLDDRETNHSALRAGRRSHAGRPRSVLALGPIPLLICLGRHLTSKVPVDVFQRHRDTERGHGRPTDSDLSFSFRHDQTRRIRTGWLSSSLERVDRS